MHIRGVFESEYHTVGSTLGGSMGWCGCSWRYAIRLVLQEIQIRDWRLLRFYSIPVTNMGYSATICRSSSSSAYIAAV